MEVMEKNKQLLVLGAKLEMCAEYKNAARVYEEYVRSVAKLSEYEDALEKIYGYNVYRNGISGYAEAIAWASVAVCAKELIKLMRSKFPEDSAWQNPNKDHPANDEIIDFFEWLGTERRVDSMHYDILKRAKRAFTDSANICIEASGSVQRLTLMDAVSDAVSGSIKVIDRKLR